MKFQGRLKELKFLQSKVGKSAFGYVTGRRRVGKSTLLRKLVKKNLGIYYQAIEGTAGQQLEDLVNYLKSRLSIFQEIQPKNWLEFFSLLSHCSLPKILVFDEFPYWIKSDPSLSSQWQRWVDQDLPKQSCLVLVSGSSQNMLYNEFLQASSPLYGRAQIHLHLQPLSYRDFCQANRYSIHTLHSFELYSVVGGIPHYWQMIPRGSLIKRIEALYFEPSGPLAEEPKRILDDEAIEGNLPRAILDLIGRGVHRPSELASRLGTQQGNLSRPLNLLLEVGLVQKDLPFGESSRSTKRVLYEVRDPSLSFYYGTFLPHRNLWFSKSNQAKQQLIHEHASKQWEHFCRKNILGASRYWESDIEIDLIAPGKSKNSLLVAECKWRRLKKNEEEKILGTLQEKFQKTKISKKYSQIQYKVFSQNNAQEIFSKID
ncbi:MAG: ATP-binding protein [Deltaproteobacteria bacterium]|nr:ATP-binding protein [Deltaproteobacteria bacterium]